MLLLEGHWLMQMCDEITRSRLILLGLFGGHLDPGETPEQALQHHRRSDHVFRAELLGSLEQPQLWCREDVGA